MLAFSAFMASPALSVTIITLNEEERIAHAIGSVQPWANEVVVVDSGSTDATVSIAKKLGARVIHHAWPGYGQQKNFAQSQASHDWVLNIDADEVVSLELRDAILKRLENLGSREPDLKGFYFPRKTFYLGRWIRRGGWYPNHLVRLAHRRFASWTEPSVHEELRVQGGTELIDADLLHYAFSSIQDQILTNVRFSHLGSQELKRAGQGPNLLRLILKPIGKFFETYIMKRGFMDGLAGFIISVNAAHSMFLKYAYLFESRIRQTE